MHIIPDSKVHVANMGPTWVLSAPDGPHVGPTNLAIRGGVAASDSEKCENHFFKQCENLERDFPGRLQYSHLWQKPIADSDQSQNI